MAKSTSAKQPFPAKHGSAVKRDRTTGQFMDQKGAQHAKRMPPRGPSNLIVRSSNPLPLPKDTASQ